MKAVWILGVLGGMVALGVIYAASAAWLGLLVAFCAYALAVVDERA
jgi:hypothetical protein